MILSDNRISGTWWGHRQPGGQAVGAYRRSWYVQIEVGHNQPTEVVRSVVVLLKYFTTRPALVLAIRSSSANIAQQSISCI